MKVKKFGGTSVADTDKIKKVAESIKCDHAAVIVVSAMSGVTNQLLEFCYNCSNQTPNFREYDSALSSGEIVTSALMSISLNACGVKAKSLNAWQLPIITDSNFSNAKILEIYTKKIFENINNNIVTVIPGFQGVDINGNITTLGRGGSDTTAVAIAASIKAKMCEIYTDVSGVFSADPRIISNAKILDEISYKSMIEYSFAGAKVLHPRSVQIASRFNVPIKVLNAHEPSTGTLIKNITMEKTIVKGIVFDTNIALFNLNSEIILLLKKLEINFSVLSHIKKELIAAVNILDMKSIQLHSPQTNFKTQLAQVSIVGENLNNSPSIIYRLMSIVNLDDVMYLTTSDNIIKFVCAQELAKKTTETLHKEFIENA